MAEHKQKTPVISVQNVFKLFKVGKQNIEVLDNINLDIYSGEFVIIFGPSGCGKSTLLKNLFPNSLYYDLLLSDEFERLNRRPALLREEIFAQSSTAPVIIDEVQKIPHLLDEIQWLIVNY